MPFPEPLENLTADEAHQLEAVAQPVQYAADACIFQEGSLGDRFYIIDEGQVRIDLERPEVDSDSVLGYVGAPHILGELSLLDGQPRSASAYAHQDVRLRAISATALAQLLDSQPRLYGKLMSALGRSAAIKLRHTNEMLAAAIFEQRDRDVDEVVHRAVAAQQLIADWPEEKIDPLLHDLAEVIAEHAADLAADTVRETKVGNASDKALKNIMASIGVYQWLAGQPAAGEVFQDATSKVTEIASPVGVVLGLIPMTNPVATAVFKSLICLKGRNAVILSFHRSARKVGNRTGDLMQEVLRRHGAPADVIQWVRNRLSRKTTEQFMRHPQVSMVLATGGASMVQAAYRSGTPAIGVGPGNAPTLICRDANLDHAAECVVMSKSFDNGLICGSEHNLVVVRDVREPFVAALIKRQAAVLDEAEAAAFGPAVTSAQTGHIHYRMVGKSAAEIAAATGITRDYPIRLIVVPTQQVTADNPFALEKMAPVLSLFEVADEAEGIEVSRQLLALEGTGHTAIIHSTDQELVRRFGQALPASRVLVNSPGSHGVIGTTTGLIPSLTLGCGTFGKNSTSDNVNFKHLLNTKRVAEYLPERMLNFLPYLKQLRTASGQ